MSAPAVHCITGSFRPHLDGLHAGMLRTICAVESDDNETSTIRRLIHERYMALQDAPEVEAGTSSIPLPPSCGRTGVGVPPAPTPVVSLAEAKRLHPSSRPAVEYVDACVYCGERSKHGRCS